VKTAFADETHKSFAGRQLNRVSFREFEHASDGGAIRTLSPRTRRGDWLLFLRSVESFEQKFIHIMKLAGLDFPLQALIQFRGMSFNRYDGLLLFS